MPKFVPIHPGEILRTEFLEELEITPYALARDAGIDKGNLSRILNGKSSITAETALRLGEFFGTSPDSWINLQAQYDLEVAKDKSLKRIRKEVIPLETIRQGMQGRAT
jgi:addiction module HigA family antidote